MLCSPLYRTESTTVTPTFNITSLYFPYSYCLSFRFCKQIADSTLNNASLLIVYPQNVQEFGSRHCCIVFLHVLFAIWTILIKHLLSAGSKIPSRHIYDVTVNRFVLLGPFGRNVVRAWRD